MRVGLLAVFLGTGLASATPRVFVDSRAASPGDGTSLRPYRSLAKALETRGSEIVLAPGRYPGPFRVRPGTSLTGTPDSVLVATTAGEPLLLVEGEVRLSGLTLETGGVPDAIAMEASRTASPVELTVSDCKILGPFRFGIRVRQQASLTVQRSALEGSDTGIYASASRVVLEEVSVALGQGPALSFQGGTLKARDVRVHGHEYALLASGGVEAKLERFTSVRASRAGVAAVKSGLEARELMVVESGPFGGIQLVGSRAVLQLFRVHRAVAYGLSARGGTLLAQSGFITDVARTRDGADGDGVHLRGGTAELRELEIQRAGGVALLAAEGAIVQLGELEVHSAGEAAIQVDTQAALHGMAVRVQATMGPALVATERARVLLKRLERMPNDSPPLFVDCASRASLSLGSVNALAFESQSPCTQPLR